MDICGDDFSNDRSDMLDHTTNTFDANILPVLNDISWEEDELWDAQLRELEETAAHS